MKNIKLTLSFLSVFFLLANLSCINTVSETSTFTANKPVYMSLADFRAEKVATKSATELVHTGKMYFYKNYIFINEIAKGVHIIDNTNPANPKNIKFIEILGNVDIVIKNDFLYADSYIDLVVLNISDLNNIKEVKRVPDVFPYQIPVYDFKYPVAKIDQSKGLVVGWTIEEVTQEYSSTGWSGGMYSYADEASSSDLSINDSSQSSDGGNGTSGSTARFVLYGNMLYMIDQARLMAYDISQGGNPIFKSEINTGRVSETLFVYENMLFSGTTTGMVVYSLENPTNPTQISAFNHIRSCDPVVVENNIAYVTLRAGQTCGGTLSQLDVIDLANIQNPKLIKSYPMQAPYGLGIRNGRLFICDGDAGLKVFNTDDLNNIDQNMTQQSSDINAFDVIPFDNLLLMIGQDGLYQYSYKEGQPLSLLSVISVGN